METEYYPTAEVVFDEKDFKCAHTPVLCGYVLISSIRSYMNQLQQTTHIRERPPSMDPLEGSSVNNALTDRDDLVFVGVDSSDETSTYTSRSFNPTREYLVENVKRYRYIDMNTTDASLQYSDRMSSNTDYVYMLRIRTRLWIRLDIELCLPTRTTGNNNVMLIFLVTRYW